jgi:hypothetical protein
MRETVGSMRAYFILTGLLGLLMNVGLLLGSQGNLLLLLIGAIGTIAGVLFLVSGARLPKLVASRSSFVPRVLLGTGVYLALYLLLGLSLGQVGIGVVVQAALGLLITWYLLRNFGRLSTQAPVGTVV